MKPSRGSGSEHTMLHLCPKKLLTVRRSRSCVRSTSCKACALIPTLEQSQNDGPGEEHRGVSDLAYTHLCIWLLRTHAR